jgi:hypothetical protein
MMSIKPVIKVWCLPPGQTEDDLRRLHQEIVHTMGLIEELALKDENDTICLFPPDQMQYGLGSEIVIEVIGLFQATHLKQSLARRLSNAVAAFYPKAEVQCFVTTFRQDEEGFWFTGPRDVKG